MLLGTYALERRICEGRSDGIVAIGDAWTTDGVCCCDRWYQRRSRAQCALQIGSEVGLADSKNSVTISKMLAVRVVQAYRPS